MIALRRCSVAPESSSQKVEVNTFFLLFFGCCACNSAVQGLTRLSARARLPVYRGLLPESRHSTRFTASPRFGPSNDTSPHHIASHEPHLQRLLSRGEI